MMPNRIIPYIVLLILLLSHICCAQLSRRVSSSALSPDTVFVQSSEWPSVEKDELIYTYNGKRSTIYTLATADGSSLNFHFSQVNNMPTYDCFVAYNSAADGNSFLFFNRANKRLYITYGCYAQFEPVPESVDFLKQTVLLKNHLVEQHLTDTLNVGRNTSYIKMENNAQIIKVEFKEVSNKISIDNEK